MNLSDTIFELLELDDRDELFENYLDWCAQLTEKDLLRDTSLLNIYANGMYEMLLSETNT